MAHLDALDDEPAEAISRSALLPHRAPIGPFFAQARIRSGSTSWAAQRASVVHGPCLSRASARWPVAGPGQPEHQLAGLGSQLAEVGEQIAAERAEIRRQQHLAGMVAGMAISPSRIWTRIAPGIKIRKAVSGAHGHHVDA